jgi:hypothetical protein
MTNTATALRHSHVTAGIAALTETGTLNRLGRERRNCTDCFAAIVAELEARREAREAAAVAAAPFVIRITRNGATQVSYASSRAAALDGTMWARAEGAEVEILAR